MDISFYLRDMVSLNKCHTKVYAEFMKENFVVKKSKHAFSAIAIDHAHEQNNAKVKWDVGAVGLTENPAALYRWMVSGSEMTRIIEEFEDSIEKKQNAYCSYQEQKKHDVQMAFAKNVQALTSVIEELGNPFCESKCDLLVLESRNNADTMQTQ